MNIKNSPPVIEDDNIVFSFATANKLDFECVIIPLDFAKRYLSKGEDYFHTDFIDDLNAQSDLIEEHIKISLEVKKELIAPGYYKDKWGCYYFINMMRGYLFVLPNRNVSYGTSISDTNTDSFERTTKEEMRKAFDETVKFLKLRL